MPVISHPFIGGMDLDSPDYNIPPGRHRSARNLIPRGNKGNQRLESQLGTNYIPNSYLPLTGTNKCIGCYFDAVNQRFFWFNYNSSNNHGIYIYNTVSGVIQRLIQSGIGTDGDILNFNAETYITSVDIIYGEPYNVSTDTGGSLLFFVDSELRPTKLNIDRYLAGVYSTVYRSFIDVAKAPPVMPIQCVYENDLNAQANNLLNSLFQFCYSFIYDDNEESVVSSGSKTPLPTIIFSPTATTPVTENARIALYMETGGSDVKSIRIYGRQTQNGTPGQWFIVDTLQKSFFSIPSNSIYRFTFSNNGNYITADPKFTVLLQDAVPQQANCQSLLDGSTISYAGITEGYNYINSSFGITGNTSGGYTPSLYTVNGVLFFGFQPLGSNQVTLYVTGVGTNNSTTNLPQTLDSSLSFIAVRAKVGSTDKSFGSTSYSGESISTILSNIGAAATGAGWTVVSTASNSITISLANVILQSTSIGNSDDTPTNLQLPSFYPYSAYSFGVVYFDAKGRTNGVITDVTANISTSNSFIYANYYGLYGLVVNLSGITPPTWATYYHLVRTNTLTYSKNLWWITNGAYSNVGQYISNQYAYLEIDNIQLYNEQIQATSDVVSYEFTQGDRVKIIGVYSATGTYTQLNYDYAIMGLVQNPILEGIQKNGTFLQIAYPTADINTSFKFDGTPNFLNYQIIIYNLASQTPVEATTNGNVYYEIGEQYYIGDAGTSSAYHMGNIADNEIGISDGDIFLRTRNVPIGATYYLPAGNYSFGNQYTTFAINYNSSTYETVTTNYTIGYQQNQEVTGTNNPPAIVLTDYPLYSDNAPFNNTSSNPITIRLRGAYTLFLNASLGTTTSSGIYVKMVNSGGTNTQLIQIVAEQKVTTAQQDYNYDFDGTITVPAGYKAFLIVSNLGVDGSGVPNLIIGQFSLRIDVLNTATINVYDASFSDSYALYTNNNSRPQVQDRTSLQTYYSTLFRYSEPYVLGTQINNTNRFYPNNFDEFDKSYGDVQRMIINGRQLKIFQNRKCGVTNVYGKFIKNQTGGTTLITTDAIITQNNIQYYDGDYGIGTQRTAICHNGYQFYFFDPVKGYLCRLSLNGVDPISEEFKVQTWAGGTLPAYNTNTYEYLGGTSKLIAVYNFLSDRDSEVLFIAQPGQYGSSTIDGETLAFIERTNQFPSFYDFAPDNALCAENVLYSWYGGMLYVHNNANTYCNYYNTQYIPQLEIVFNDFNEVKKTWRNLQINSNVAWACPLIYTQLNAVTGSPQVSSLIESDFKLLEGEYQAAFLRDADSPNGLINGDFLKGTFIVINFQVTDGYLFAYIINPSVKWTPSQLNNR